MPWFPELSMARAVAEREDCPTRTRTRLPVSAITKAFLRATSTPSPPRSRRNLSSKIHVPVASRESKLSKQYLTATKRWLGDVSTGVSIRAPDQSRQPQRGRRSLHRPARRAPGVLQSRSSPTLPRTDSSTPYACITAAGPPQAPTWCGLRCSRGGHIDHVVGRAKLSTSGAWRLATGEMVPNAFEADAEVREPSGGPYRYSGADHEKIYDLMFANGGGIPLEFCTVTDDSAAGAIEYNCTQWGKDAIPAQAGVAVYVRGESGRLSVEPQFMTTSRRLSPATPASTTPPANTACRDSKFSKSRRSGRDQAIVVTGERVPLR